MYQHFSGVRILGFCVVGQSAFAENLVLLKLLDNPRLLVKSVLCIWLTELFSPILKCRTTLVFHFYGQKVALHT